MAPLKDFSPVLFVLFFGALLGFSAFAEEPSWTNPNVPFRIPFFEPANYPKWTDAESNLTPGTPAACDPKTFIPQFAKGDALDAYFASDENTTQSKLKSFFNGHPIRFPSGKVLFPVGVGKVKAYKGDGSRRLHDVFAYMEKKSGAAASTQDNGASFQSCTTYFNEGNKDAQNAFQWIYIPTDMKGKTKDPARIAESAKVFVSSFSQVLPRLLACEDKFDYYAFGCQAAFERTPTIFAMILKEAGCSTDNSVFIADMLLGRNDIPLETRKAIVDQTPIDPATQKQLQHFFFTPDDSE